MHSCPRPTSSRFNILATASEGEFTQCLYAFRRGAKGDRSCIRSHSKATPVQRRLRNLASVQYSFSDDGQTMVETLVLHVRDPKDLIQVSMDDSASAIGSAANMVAANTPVNRVRLERFGKSSVALARCSASQNGPAPDQNVYEPLFRGASEVLTNYRRLLGVGRIVPAELAQIPGASTNPDTKPKSAKAKAQKK